MPDTRVKAVSASELTASEEASKLEEFLRRQLEDDIARIFDESIYSDLEVACGKFKIPTHSCILKTRSIQFFHKLETFLHVDLGSNLFDELYSFISDAYTDCNIKNQEKEILKFMNNSATELELSLTKSDKNKDNESKTNTSLNPSTQLKKEYYALLPSVDVNLLDQELSALSTLHSVKQIQNKEENNSHTSHCTKPTSLSLISSHSSKTVKHSNRCDILVKFYPDDNSLLKDGRVNEIKTNGLANQNLEENYNSESNKDVHKILSGCDSSVEKLVESIYSPDSLITDDASSSSDYLSAGFTCSPCMSTSANLPQLNIGDNITKMDKILNFSDSGLENISLLENLTEGTFTDISLTENTLHELTSDETNQLNNFTHSTSALADKTSLSDTSTETSNGQKVNKIMKIKETMNNKSSEEEKPVKKTCEILENESKQTRKNEKSNESQDSFHSELTHRSPHNYFIDLSSLPDPLPPEKNKQNESSEKKNLFSMYIDLGEKSRLKKMPARLSSSVDAKNNNSEDSKNVTQIMPGSQRKAIEEPSTSVKLFEEYEALCNDHKLTLSEIKAIAKETLICKKSIKKTEQTHNVNGDKPQHTTSVIEEEPTDNQQHTTSVIEEEPTDNQTADLFVKLSDLDKPAIKTDKSLVSQNDSRGLDVRMTRSIPENTWRENYISILRSSDIMNSFHSENALSLNRLFPHLKNELSKSMPGSLSGRTASPLRHGASFNHREIKEQTSQVSDVSSSMQSSVCCSVIDSSTEDTSQISNLIASCQSRLGQDLLRMFLEEIAPDVIVEVSGRRFKAHKCILSSRCRYFAGILSGGFVESSGNVILMPNLPADVVLFALYHIYSGISDIPDTISIVELTNVSDILGLEGLKEAIMFTLKTKYCHHFHKPCHVCIAGVLECFSLTSLSGLDDLYFKCLRWITKYFPKVWPTKAFATLSTELLEKCYQQQLINLSTETFIDIVYGCSETVASLQDRKWAGGVAGLCCRLLNAAASYAASHLVDIFKAISSVPTDAPRYAKDALEKCITAAIERAPPEGACRAYAYLSGLVRDMRSTHSKPDLTNNNNQASKASVHASVLFKRVNCWRWQCEDALVRAAPRVVATQAFKDLPSDLREKLRELGCIAYNAHVSPRTRELRPGTTNSRTPKPNNAGSSRDLDMERVRTLFIPYATKPVSRCGESELSDVSKSRTSPLKVRTTKAQEERARFNQIKTNSSRERVNPKSTAVRLNAFQNTKPRYLEPKMSKENEKKAVPAKKFVSSSESSRNPSPVQVRKLRSSRLMIKKACETRGEATSQDSLTCWSRSRTPEPSTDSLSESQATNKLGTYTRADQSKKLTKGMKTNKYPSSSKLVSHSQYSERTKIPVSVKQPSKAVNLRSSKGRDAVESGTIPMSSRQTGVTRNVPQSLMKATKASQAKMVPKVSKEPSNHRGVNIKYSKTATKHANSQKVEKSPDTPAKLNRSGTFLKDEPSFDDKTTNVDEE